MSPALTNRYIRPDSIRLDPCTVCRNALRQRLVNFNHACALLPAPELCAHVLGHMPNDEICIWASLSLER